MAIASVNSNQTDNTIYPNSTTSTSTNSTDSSASRSSNDSQNGLNPSIYVQTNNQYGKYIGVTFDHSFTKDDSPGQTTQGANNNTQTGQNTNGTQGGDTGSKGILGSTYNKTSFDVASWDPQNMPSGSVVSTDLLKGQNGSLSVSALGYDTNAGASLGVKGGALSADINGGANAYLGKINGQADWSNPALLGGSSLKADGSATAGAGVDGSGKAEFDPTHGTLDCSADASCFAGVKAEGSVDG